MDAEDSLLRHIPIWHMFRFGRTRSGERAVSKYTFCPPPIACLIEGRLAFQQSTRDQIPVWSGLLIVYATIFIPVLFSLLVAINILVWSKVRVNHVFIFGESSPPSKIAQGSTLRTVGLNSKTKIDHRQYLEVCPVIRLLAEYTP